MQPFLKWPGGKRWLVSRYKHIFPNEFGTYFEPFLGGGSVFFYLLPENAFISDTNQELINAYSVMASDPDALRCLLEKHQQKHSEIHYYEIRKKIPNDPLTRAARFLYLNRTCFNGMYRVNKNGIFNVPIGTKKMFIGDVSLFNDYSAALKKAKIRAQDFVDTINDSKNGDLIFADPPYTIARDQNSFIKYNENLFSWNDQLRLLVALTIARDRGVRIISTNAFYKPLEELYRKKGFYTQIVKRFSSISGLPEGRKRLEELLITSWKVKI